MKVVGRSSRRPLRLRSEGEIVRVEPLGPGAGFAIAVQCKRPIMEMEDHLPAASQLFLRYVAVGLVYAGGGELGGQ